MKRGATNYPTWNTKSVEKKELSGPSLVSIMNVKIMEFIGVSVVAWNFSIAEQNLILELAGLAFFPLYLLK